MLEDLQPLFELLVGIISGISVRITLPCVPAERTIRPFSQAFCRTRLVRSLSGSLRPAVLHELEGAHGAEAPRLADEREALEETAEPLLDPAADGRTALGETFGFDERHGGERRGARDGVAGVGSAEAARPAPRP